MGGTAIVLNKILVYIHQHILDYQVEIETNVLYRQEK